MASMAERIVWTAAQNSGSSETGSKNDRSAGRFKSMLRLPLGLGSRRSNELRGPIDVHFDILTHIMSFLVAKDLLCYMRSCRALYYAGLPLLGRSAVFNGDPRTAKRGVDHQKRYQSFIRFMGVDPPLRCSYLRTVIICLEQTTPQLAEGIHQMVEHGRYLDTLQLRLHCEDLLEANPRIATAISSLTNLKLLSLSRVGRKSYAMLSALQSSLVHADIRILSKGAGFVNEALARSRFTLQTLFAVCDSIKDCDVVYTSVMELTLHGVPAQHTIGLLVRTFPVLRRLHLGIVIREPHATDAIEEVRRENIAAQADNCWDGLEYLSGDPIAFYLFAPQCRIQYLRFCPVTAINSRVLFPAICDTRPLSLDLIATVDSLNSLKRILNDLNLALFASEVQYLKFVSVSDFLARYNRKKKHHTDLAAIAYEAARVAPSLRYIFIHLTGQPAVFFRVNQDEVGSKSLVELPVAEGKKIIKDEGLQRKIKHMDVFYT